jgi:hypothetical protein
MVFKPRRKAGVVQDEAHLDQAVDHEPRLPHLQVVHHDDPGDEAEEELTVVAAEVSDGVHAVSSPHVLKSGPHRHLRSDSPHRRV